MNIDLVYLSQNLASLTGIPVRIYKNNHLDSFISNIKFKRDPFILDEDKVISKTDHLGYYLNDDFFYYVYCKSNDTSIIIGPARQTPASENVLRRMTLNLNLSKEEIEPFLSSMKMIINMPLRSLLQALATVNYILNDEQINVNDFFTEQIDLSSSHQVHNEVDVENIVHNSYLVEKEIEECILQGNLQKFYTLIKNLPSFTPGFLSQEALRQQKNTFIVTTTLNARSAIKAGMDINESLSISDFYIQKCELLNSVKEINDLSYQMTRCYIEKVASIKGKSALEIRVRSYVMNHLSENIKLKNLAEDLRFSVSHLCSLFKKETGKTINAYINEMKLVEAKNLLTTDATLSSISNYLGFSSQSHFSNAFKKYTGITPYAYKEKQKHS